MDSPSVHLIPPEPRSIEDTGLSSAVVSNLALKMMYVRGFLSGHDISEALKLPFVNVVDRALDFLRREHLSEVRGAGGGITESAYQYVISDKGRARARELMNEDGYVGPAPVTLNSYIQAVKSQSVAGRPITPETIREATRHMVLSDAIFSQIGPAVNSAKSIFLHGRPGNGKTALAEAIGTMLHGNIYIPHAINADGHIIKLFDPLNHRPIEGDGAAAGLRRGERFDRRWVLVHRPVIIAGGELTLDSLDLVFDQNNRFYEAPYQMKANGGLFLIDDFGRQQVRPRDLLNRWIIPLEKRIDYLTLANGRKIEVPFDALIIFATNMDPADLVDEAFLRRIRYKIEMPDPTWEQYREIFINCCKERGIPYNDDALRYLINGQYVKTRRKPRSVHPRDILDELLDIARYHGVTPALTPELLDQACATYFLKE
jgi:predicted ATPase with chaperone activity